MYSLTETISELLDTPVVERSVNAMLHCPFHDDDKPSFSIHLDEGLWYCFGCAKGGNIGKLFTLLGERMPEDIALAQKKRLAEEPDVVLDPRLDDVAYLNYKSLPQGYELWRAYAGIRQISDAVIPTFRVGLHPSKQALSFPYIDENNRVTGIKYRNRGGYKTSEIGSTYGLYNVGNIIGREEVIICEGESDTHSVFTRYGKDYAVGGTSGASVSESQWVRFGLHLLFARRIYLLYDADEAGDKCAETAMRVLGTDKCRRLRPVVGKDATETLIAGYSLEEIGLGD